VVPLEDLYDGTVGGRIFRIIGRGIHASLLVNERIVGVEDLELVADARLLAQDKSNVGSQQSTHRVCHGSPSSAQP
jgi:hypothetical protein